MKRKRQKQIDIRVAQITDISRKLKGEGASPRLKAKLMLQQFCGKHNFQERHTRIKHTKPIRDGVVRVRKAREKISKRVTAGTSKEELKGLW